MKNGKNGRSGETEVVRKPFLTGNVMDERTLKSSLAFFGIMVVVIFITLIACATATLDIVIPERRSDRGMPDDFLQQRRGKRFRRRISR